jgi:peptide/nickel transport system substrate-binding protein
LKRALRVIAVVTVRGVVGAACGGDEPAPPGESPTAGEELAGGTLRMAMLADVISAFDPQKEYYSVTWEYYRCCLLRNLMSYEGVPTDEGGADIFPDLAAEEPTVSEDGLTTTFTIKPGLMYAPPKDDTEITAGDFIRAMERLGLIHI